jgi:copper homeostasis protein
MVRPRGGDFCHTDEEFAVMAEDVRIFKEEGVDAVVFGLLTPEATIDVERTKALIEQARPLQVTFHRAFDMTRDPFEALDTLIELGVDRILTSGQEPSVFEGSDLIRRLIEHATGRIIIMPGCGITLKNVQRVIAETGANEIHVAAPAAQPSLMTFQNDEVFMGTALRSEEYMRYVTPAESVRQFRSKVNP